MSWREPILATTSQAAPISRTAKKGRVMSKLLVLAQIAVAALTSSDLPPFVARKTQPIFRANTRAAA